MDDENVKYTALAEYVLLKVLKPKSQTESGLILPAAHDEPSLEGIVISAGAKARLEKNTRVLYDRYAGITLADGTLAVSISDIYAVIEEDENAEQNA